MGLLRGSVMFVTDLMRKIHHPLTMDFMSVSSYAGNVSTGFIRIDSDHKTNINGWDVILIDDIVDSGYTIYTRDGNVFKWVANARDQNDDTPTVVTLPAGSYRVEAQAINCDSSRVNVLIPVVVKPGQGTLAYLEGGWRPEGDYGQTELARLPCGRAIGWRASEAGFASTH